MRLVLFVLTMLTLAAPARAQDRLIDLFPVLSGTEHIEHVSPRLKRPLQVFIRRPPGIANGEALPVVYTLDADGAFPLLASYGGSLAFSDELEPAVLVGIGYGSTEQGVNFRNTDYTVPSDVRAEAGGAATFLAVIEEEIIPMVEARTKIDPARRTLIGQSLGGHFVLYQALVRPGLFDLGIAINPAIHNSPDWFLDALANAPEGRAQHLYIGSAENESPRFRPDALRFVRVLAAREVAPWCVRVEMLDDHHHLSSLPRGYRNGLRWRLNDEKRCGQIDPRLLAD